MLGRRPGLDLLLALAWCLCVAASTEVDHDARYTIEYRSQLACGQDTQPEVWDDAAGAGAGAEDGGVGGDGGAEDGGVDGGGAEDGGVAEGGGVAAEDLVCGPCTCCHLDWYAPLPQVLIDCRGAASTVDVSASLVGYQREHELTVMLRNQSFQLSSEQGASTAALDLRGSGLTRIPEAVGNAPTLKWLELSGNKLTRVGGAVLGSLRNLLYLNLERNAITSVEERGLANQTRLRFLYLGWNQLHDAPAVLGPALVALHLSDNGLRNITRWVEHGHEALGNLATLDLTDNALTLAAPEEQQWLSSLASLRKLLLGGNQIARITNGMFPAPLKELQLYRNLLSSLDADAFAGLCCLSRLSLFGNRIAEIGWNA